MEYEDLRIIVRLAVEVRELSNLLLDSQDGRIEKLDEIIKDARELGGIHECGDDGLLTRAR